jgi:alpha-beta hydrolase superfamily lysophospholipase
MRHIEGEFPGSQDRNLYYQGWLPANKPRALLLVAHGLAEHSGRYLNLANHFVPQGYVIYSFDYRGHGRSPGLPGYIERFADYINDLHAFGDMVRKKHQDSKFFLFGHSMGGTIAITYAVQHQDGLDGLLVSAATLQVGASIPPVKILAAKMLSRLLPRVGLEVIDAATISRDPDVVAAYVNDPLVYRGKIRARLGAELIKAIQKLPPQMAKINLPILIMHGTADRLSEPGGSQILYQGVSSRDKTLTLYDGFYHEIFNEPGRQQVFADIETWLDAHT